MPEKQSETVVPTGFIEAAIKIRPPLSGAGLIFVSAFVTIVDPKRKGEILDRRSVMVGTSQLFPLPPGEFAIFAELGAVTSPAQQVVVRAGETTRVEIYFGK